MPSSSPSPAASPYMRRVRSASALTERRSIAIVVRGISTRGGPRALRAATAAASSSSSSLLSLDALRTASASASSSASAAAS